MAGYLRKRGVRIVLLAGIALATLWFVFALQAIFAPLILGFLIAYVLDPLADRLQKRGMSRTGAVVTIFGAASLVVISVVTVSTIYAVRGARAAFFSVVGEWPAQPGAPQAVANPDYVADPEERAALPSGDRRRQSHFADRNRNGVWDIGYIERARLLALEWASENPDDTEHRRLSSYFQGLATRLIDDFTDEEGHVDFIRASRSRLVHTYQETRSPVKALLAYVQEDPPALPLRVTPPSSEEVAAQAVDRVLRRFDERLAEPTRPPASATASLFAFLSWCVLCPLYVFFFLLQIDEIIAVIHRHLPAVQRDVTVRIFQQADRILSAFFRGRLTVCVIKGVLTSIGLMACGVDFGLPIGLMAGFVSLIPYVGIWLAIVPAELLVWLEHESLVRMLVVGAVFAAMEVIEGFVLIPAFLGKEIGLHPLTIIVTLLVFGKLFGLVGVLLSVPLAAMTKILAAEFVLPLIREFADERPPPDPAPPDPGP